MDSQKLYQKPKMGSLVIDSFIFIELKSSRNCSKTGLRRTGKSCRLRWLNYLRPDVRRGNITLEEQLLILELHSRWGNRYISQTLSLYILIIISFLGLLHLI